MGTHPIFESDFDCLTECCLVELPKSLELLFDTDLLVPQSIHQLQLIAHGSQTSKSCVMEQLFASSFTLDQLLTAQTFKLGLLSSSPHVYFHLYKDRKI